MSYLLTFLLSVICIATIIKSKNLTTLVVLFITTVTYGFLLFPEIDGIVEAVKWRMNNLDGTVTYSFTTRAIEKNWSNPGYWNYLINHAIQDYWRAVWPAYFGMMYLIARILRPSGIAP